jgi:RNA polymerase sigma-70 factor (ECF subfamily)
VIGRRDPFENPEHLLDRVYAYVAYRIGPGAAAEDVTSEAIERALRYRSSFDPERGDPAAWLIGIARRCVTDALAERTALPLDEAQLAPGGRFEEALEERIELERALRALEPRERELVALRYGADLSAAQIGELLEMRAGAVRVALHRAIERLRAELDAGGGRGPALDPEPEPNRGM